MAVKDHDLHRSSRQPTGHLHRRSRVHYRVGDQFAGEQHCIVDELIPAGRPAGHLPCSQRVPDESARGRGSRGFRLVCRGRNEIIPCLHVPS
jgi:hypothetical protein